MARCSFCKESINPGTGLMLVRKDGKKLFFCSSKCEKNLLKLGRKAKDQKWVVKDK